MPENDSQLLFIVSVVTETILKVMCKFDHPEVSSHHDLLLSEFTLPSQEKIQRSKNLISAPRTTRNRSKVVWNEEGEDNYCELVASQLRELRLSCAGNCSRAETSVILQSTNHIMNLAASLTNPSVSLNVDKPIKVRRTPRKIAIAKRKLSTKHQYLQKKQTEAARNQFESARQK